MKITDINAITGKANERQATSDEVAQSETDAINHAKELEELNNQQIAKQIAREAILERLGITADEAALLLS
jgi:hypothetical protein